MFKEKFLLVSILILFTFLVGGQPIFVFASICIVFYGVNLKKAQTTGRKGNIARVRRFVIVHDASDFSAVEMETAASQYDCENVESVHYV